MAGNPVRAGLLNDFGRQKKRAILRAGFQLIFFVKAPADCRGAKSSEAPRPPEKRPVPPQNSENGHKSRGFGLSFVRLFHSKPGDCTKKADGPAMEALATAFLTGGGTARFRRIPPLCSQAVCNKARPRPAFFNKKRGLTRIADICKLY